MKYEMKRRKLWVFLFFMLQSRRSRCERTTKVWVKNIFEERQAKGTFNLMM